jgi:hypothetical protein
MYKITIRDRVFLLATVLLAAYQIIAGLEGLQAFSIWAYTIGFGTLLVSCLLLVILGFEGFESQAVVIVSTAIPLSISLGMVVDQLPGFHVPYLIFCLAGFTATVLSRFLLTGKAAVLVLALTHGIAGLTITFLPLALYLQGAVSSGYLLVSLGGAVIGLGGLALVSLRTGKPLFPETRIYRALPGLLLLMSLFFIGGFSYG